MADFPTWRRKHSDVARQILRRGEGQCGQSLVNKGMPALAPEESSAGERKLGKRSLLRPP